MLTTDPLLTVEKGITKPANTQDELSSSRNTGRIGWFPVRLITWSCSALKYLACEAAEYFHCPEKNLEQRKIKTVFVGAGPIGLWAAIQHKLNNPDADIRMFDKHSTYTRKHTVRVDLDSFKGAKMNLGLKFLKMKIEHLHGRIGCNVLEEQLLGIAKDLEIKVNNNGAEVTEIGPDSITLKDKTVVHYDQLVGADGAHSKMRKALQSQSLEKGKEVDLKAFGREDKNEEFSMRREIQYRARVRYQVKGDTKRLKSTWFSWMKHYYPVSKLFGSPVDEHIGPLKDNGTRTITLDFFVNQDEYDTLYKDGKGFNLSHPANLADLPESLSKKIRTWQELKHRNGEVKVEGSVEATPYALMYFQSKKVTAVTSQDKPVYLVGDCATALPYFRSLNNGLKCANGLGKSLARGDRKPHRSKALTDNYDRLVDLRARKEFVVARLKDRAVSLLNGTLRLVNRSPLQLSYFKVQPAN